MVPEKQKFVLSRKTWRYGRTDFSVSQIIGLSVALTLLMSIPIWTHPLPPLSDYVNHLARMRVISDLSYNRQLATYYQLDWQVIPNLAMDIFVPPLTQIVNVYVAGQIFLVAIFVVIISGAVTLNRVLVGRFSVLPLLTIPLLYNYVFLVGLTNYLFGIGVALWALAAWIATRELAWPLRLLLSTAFIVLLFFCHLSALGIYGIGLLAVEVLRLLQRKSERWPVKIAGFVLSGVPFLIIGPLLYTSPTMQVLAANSWEQRGKLDGLIYVFATYSDIAAFALAATIVAGAVWAARRKFLRFHPLAMVLLVIGGIIYFALPRVMFDTYMTDQRVPLGLTFMLFACGDLDTHRRLVRRAFLTLLVVLIGLRLLEIDYNWSQLSDSTSEFRSSVRRIAAGSKVFVAYANASAGDDVRELGLVHAACIATIERSALVTTLFTVEGKQVIHVRPEYRDFADIHDGTPPSTAQLIVAAEHPLPDMPAFWLNWTKFDYIYILFTEDDAANPDPSRLRLVADGDRFQLYRVIKP